MICFCWKYHYLRISFFRFFYCPFRFNAIPFIVLSYLQEMHLSRLSSRFASILVCLVMNMNFVRVRTNYSDIRYVFLCKCTRYITLESAVFLFAFCATVSFGVHCNQKTYMYVRKRGYCLDVVWHLEMFFDTRKRNFLKLTQWKQIRMIYLYFHVLFVHLKSVCGFKLNCT